ncbi:beta strand repeat-containing protein, partial [Undibacterium sp.]|uniref:beta strand repeat-containing protein n=1 Tax=Undibacterium sp. TaxID=1914977 RepID=UPI0037504A50
GTTAVAGDSIEILLAGSSFTTPVTRVLSAAEVTAKTVTLTIGVGSGWGGDGIKGLTARFIDAAGNLGTASGLVNITIDGFPPNPTAQPLSVAVASNGISNVERLAGVNVVVDLNGTGAVVGDTITILIDGVGFPTPVTQKITSAQITAKLATVLIPSSALWGADSVKVLSATITDASGNISLNGGDVNVILDTTAPVAPTNPVAIAAAANGISAAEKTAGVTVSIDLSGSTAVVGDRLDLLIGGLPFTVPLTQTLTALDLANSVVNFTIGTASGWGTDGVKLISTRLTDIAGNIGSAGLTTSVLLDTATPAGPTSALVVGANSGGGISVVERNAGVDVVVNLNGTTVVAGDLVEILIAGLPFTTSVNHVLTAAEVLAKSVTLTIAGTDGWGVDGSKVLTARFADIAGNVGSASGALTVTIDGNAPNSPATPLIVAAATNGISNAEKVAGVSVSVSLVGTGTVAGDTIRLQLDTVDFATPVIHTITAAQITAQAATVLIPGSAVWGADGSKLLTANFTDVLGNIGTAGGDVTVILDTTPPSSPVNPVTIASASNGLSLSEKSAGVSVSVDLSGSGFVAGESIELLLNSFAFATPVLKVLTALDISNGAASLLISGTANWGADGSKVISVRGIDLAGNLGAGGGDLTVVLDTVAPVGPTNALVVAANAGGGLTAAEKNAGVLVDVNLSGTSLVAGDRVEILIGGLAFSTPVVHVLTALEISANLVSLTIDANDGWGADGSKALTARFIDLAGNVGAGSGTVSVLILDTTPPNVPSSPMIVGVAANGINLSEKNAGVSVLVNLAGTNAVAGDVATLLIDGNGFTTPVTYAIGAADVTAGNFSFTIGSGDGWGGDGSKILSMSITDVAGNIGSAGGNVAVSLDTTLPNAPANAVVVAAAASGINATEKTLGVTVVVDLSGTNAVVGDRVEILLGGASFGTPVLRTLTSLDISGGSVSVFIDGSTSWGTDGVKTLSARIQDVAGNFGLAGGSLTTTLDTSIPTAGGVPVYTDVDSSGTINSGDTFVFMISEATNKAITISDLLVNNAHIFGVGAISEWSTNGMQLTLTLGAGTDIAVGDIVTLVGVSDLAGNSLNLAFSI